MSRTFPIISVRAYPLALRDVAPFGRNVVYMLETLSEIGDKGLMPLQKYISKNKGEKV